MFLDFRCLRLEDCCAEPIGAAADRTNHEASLLLVETLFGWVASSAALLEALTPAPGRPGDSVVPRTALEARSTST
jgi:hypothetical protein